MTQHPDPRSFDSADSGALVPADPATLHPAENLPMKAVRHDGWTAARQAAFLRELAATHNVSAAARAVGMSRQSAYALRNRLQHTPFDAAWQAAYLTRFDALAEAALDRAINGVEVPHYYNGELVGTSRRYDERLTLALLAQRRAMPTTCALSERPETAYDPDELGALIERVARGPEDWLDDSDAELEVRGLGGTD